MVKKRSKPRKTSKSAASKKALDKKLDLILENQRRILSEEKKIERKEESIEQLEEDIEQKEDDIEEEEKKIEAEEDKLEDLEESDATAEKKLEEIGKAEMTEIEKLERLEKEIKSEVSEHPLKKITYHDFVKAIIGSFFGIVGHFAFIYGTHIADVISYTRATMLYVISFIIAVAFIYFSGFRRVRDYKAATMIPVRVITIYFVSLLVVAGVLFVFGYADISNGFGKLYKDVGAISILAILGACAADLVGKE